MKNRNKIVYGMLLFLTTAFTSCDNNGIDDLDFDVSLQNPETTVKVGEPVTFAFSGDPDYLIFYSGEYGKKYANRNRTKADVESLILKYNLELKYARINYRNGLKVLISEDFNGIYDEENIKQATWSDMDGQLKVPVIESSYEGYQHGEVRDIVVDMGNYKDKKFYLALRYEMSPLTEDEIANNQVHPDAYFYPKLQQSVDGKTIEKTSPKNDFGFGFVRIKYNSNSSDNPTQTVVDDQRVSINGRKGKDGTYIWAVSQAVDASKVNADEGLSIKSLSYSLPSYTHIYNEPGEYTVTFVARNANAWNCTEQIKEIKVTVVE